MSIEREDWEEEGCSWCSGDRVMEEEGDKDCLEASATM